MLFSKKLEFLSEAETLKIFDHKNIVKLLGVCTKGEPAFAVMDGWQRGRVVRASDLKSVVRGFKSRSDH